MNLKRIREVYESPAYTQIAKSRQWDDVIPQAWFADIHQALGAALKMIDDSDMKKLVPEVKILPGK